MSPLKSPRRKGAAKERELVRLFEAAGVPARRVPMSGGGSIPFDVQFGEGYRFNAEVKARKGGAGFMTLERWMAGADALVLFRDRQPPMVCVEWELFAELMAMRSEGKGSDGDLQYPQRPKTGAP